MIARRFPAVLLAGTALLVLPAFAASAADGPARSLQKPAVIVAGASHAAMLAVARAGKRIVAVGDHGVVLLSDDDGVSFRQAHGVPTQALLTSVWFADDRLGWIVGHDGVVLQTTNGGNSWSLQREDTDGDKPLFAVYFSDAQHGLAVGLFGTAIHTDDGGAHWQTVDMGAANQDGHHLYAIFDDGPHGLFIAGEAGLILRSADGGVHWDAVQTTNPGSFWSGARLADGTLIAAGQRGHVFRSADNGVSWNEIESGTQESLTDIVVLRDGSVAITGLAGVVLRSTDEGRHFALTQRNDRAPLTAALELGSGALQLFGDGGIIAPGQDH